VDILEIRSASVVVTFVINAATVRATSSHHVMSRHRTMPGQLTSSHLIIASRQQSVTSRADIHIRSVCQFPMLTIAAVGAFEQAAVAAAAVDDFTTVFETASPGAKNNRTFVVY
jgi:hypothetical protein